MVSARCMLMLKIGVIRNAGIPGYFPFSQTIRRAWVDRYRDSSYYANYEFSFDNSGSIYDPDDKPYGFKYDPDVYLYDNNYNKMKPFFYWTANGTIPSARTFQGVAIDL